MIPTTDKAQLSSGLGDHIFSRILPQVQPYLPLPLAYVRTCCSNGKGGYGYGCGLISPLDAFTIHAVGQDNFEDVRVPDAPAQPVKTPSATANGSTS